MLPATPVAATAPDPRLTVVYPSFHKDMPFNRPGAPMQAYNPTPRPDADLAAAAQHLIPSATATRQDPAFPGHLIVDTDDGTLAVRRWDPEATTATATWITEGLRLANAAGAAVPTVIAGPILHAGRIYDAIPWPSSRPLNRYGTFSFSDGTTIDLPLPDSMNHPETVADAIRTLGRLHVATTAHAEVEGSPSFTLADLLKTTQASYAALRKTLGRHAAGNQEIRRWLRCGNRVLPASETRIKEAGDIATAKTAMLHTEPWTSRILTDDANTLLQLTGFTRAAAGSPLLDLARIAARGARWSAATAETVVGTYLDVAPLRPEQRRLLPVIAALDLTLTTGQMLHTTYDIDAIAADPAQSFVRSGVQTALRSLETLANVLEPQATRTFSTRPGQRPGTGGIRPAGRHGGGRIGQRRNRST